MNDAIVAFEKEAKKYLGSVLSDTLNASGVAAAKTLKDTLSMRSAEIRDMGFRTTAPKIKDFKFDRTNPAAVSWIEDHAAETITGISDVTREQIRDLVEASFEEQFDVDDLADEIADVIGNDTRAEIIARTETMRASNQGQAMLWEQAKEQKLLTGKESQVWIVTPDDRLCPVCEPLDGQTVELGEKFDVAGVGSVDGPPAHPNCRCTVGLSL